MGMNRDVSRFALGVAALVFGCFVIFLLGTASARDWLNSSLGPFSVGVWLILTIHVFPVVFGIVHMNRASSAELRAASSDE